jgi:hypothetical protein
VEEERFTVASYVLGGFFELPFYMTLGIFTGCVAAGFRSLTAKVAYAYALHTLCIRYPYALHTLCMRFAVAFSMRQHTSAYVSIRMLASPLASAASLRRSV